MSGPDPVVDIAARLESVRDRISAAGGDLERVRLVAVTKGFGPGTARAALQSGISDLGENYAQELGAKQMALADGVAERRWHLIGPVQRNKVSRVAPFVWLWQAVDRLAAGQAIARAAPGARVLVQVNTSGEEGKSGCSAADAGRLVDDLRELGLEVRGLMTIGPRGDPALARPGFAAMASLAQRLGLPERSMGMSADFDIAVAEGATIIRLGAALFGPRPTRRDLRR